MQRSWSLRKLASGWSLFAGLFLLGCGEEQTADQAQAAPVEVVQVTALTTVSGIHGSLPFA
jgi:hypothetical protein